MTDSAALVLSPSKDKARAYFDKLSMSGTKLNRTEGRL
jgi:hypothetical protein